MSTYQGFRLPPLAPTKRKVFVAYHHNWDQGWYEILERFYCDGLDLFTNRSLPEPVDTDDIDYAHRAIRERYITGTSITIVLCGWQTWKRKCVDWEIGATLNKGHALLGIGLPTATRTWNGVWVPDRYYHNWLTGYAAWLDCPQFLPDASTLNAAIEEAILRSTLYPPDNSWPFMSRNRS